MAISLPLPGANPSPIKALKISRSNDPFKKYWWVLLVVFGLIASVICIPALQKAGSSLGGAGEKPIGGGEDSLDAKANMTGAPGAAMDLSMEDGAYRKKTESKGMTSSLYQAPDAAPGAPIADNKGAGAKGSASVPSTLADALAGVNKGKDAGGWGEKAQRGFAPKGNFGALHGLGAATAGGTSAVGAFGTPNAQPGFAPTSGASAGGGGGGGGNASLRALRTASGNAMTAAGSRSLDAGAAAIAKSFDGAGNTANKAKGNSKDAATYAKLDESQAPANLKQPIPPKKPEDVKDTKPAPLPSKDGKDSQQADDPLDPVNILRTITQSLIGGIMNATIGQMFNTSSSNADKNNQNSNSLSGTGNNGK